MLLSIVIGTYNRLPILKVCLASLIGKISVEHEIVVTDAGSTDGTLEYLRGLASNKQNCLRLIEDGKKIGQARSINNAVETLSSEFMCWLSDDNEALPGMLDKSVSILAKNPDIGLLAFKIKDITGVHTDVPYLGGMWKPLYILNCNQGMLPVSLWKQIGGFDEDFRDYGIDGDLTTKVLLAGYKVVFTRELAVLHYRDHDTESWIDSEGRKKRMDEARQRYKAKYAHAIEAYSGYKKNTAAAFGTKIIERIRKSYSETLEKKICARFGYCDRDVFNVNTGNFISKWDLFLNRRKSYYLVQKIPSKLLKLIEGYKSL